MAKLTLQLLVACLLISSVAQAQTEATTDFNSWLQLLEQDALAEGISPETVHAALDDSELNDRVIELDRQQPENTVAFDEYFRGVVSAKRIATGRALLRDNIDDLQQIAKQYGVQPEIIVALWGMESSYGKSSGKFEIVSSLLTLAREGRRAELFRKELFDALRIIDQEKIPPKSLTGSWAGAMGQCQFMPSTYLHHAVDYDADGKRDIWHNQLDIWASIANYLSSEGWDGQMGWGREVELDSDIGPSNIGLNVKHELATWAQMGVTTINGNNLPNSQEMASLIQPDGAEGRSFLVNDNFRALMRWNRSTYFATTVGLLADRIKR